MIHPELHAGAACLEPPNGHCGRLAIEDALSQILEGDRIVWLNLYGEDDAKARELLENRIGYHELAVEDAISDRERPTLQEYGEVLFFDVPVILPGNDDEDAFPELAFFLTERTLVTYSRVRLEVVSLWFERWQQRPLQVGSNPARLAHTLLDAVVDAYFPTVDAIEDEVDRIADAVFYGDVQQVQHIQRLKRRIMLIRRSLSPTRDVVNALLRRDLVAMPPGMGPYFQDVMDHVLRLGETIDLNRDTLASLLDVHLSTVSNKINEVMKRMTFYATALMTSGLIAGIYGMNFEHMPELHWTFGYPFALMLMAMSFFGVWAAFKRRGWL